MKLSEKVGRRCEQAPHKRDIQMISRHMKTHSISLVTREMQTKITRYNYMSIKVKTTDNASVGKDAEQLELSCMVVQLLCKIIW